MLTSGNPDTLRKPCAAACLQKCPDQCCALTVLVGWFRCATPPARIPPPPGDRVWAGRPARKGAALRFASPVTGCAGPCPPAVLPAPAEPRQVGEGNAGHQEP